MLLSYEEGHERISLHSIMEYRTEKLLKTMTFISMCSKVWYCWTQAKKADKTSEFQIQNTILPDVMLCHAVILILSAAA